MAKVLIINGPNLNLLGHREPEIYGTQTLEDLMLEAESAGEKHGLDISWLQSNKEDEIVTQIQDAIGQYQALIVNAAAYTHTSIAIMDALKAFNGKIIEVHLSNIYKREEFRHNSYISPIADGIICGFGGKGYVLAVESLKDL